MQCEQNTLNKLCNGITTINDSIKALDAVHQKAEALDGQEQANVYAHEVVPAMDTLRAAVDQVMAAEGRGCHGGDCGRRLLAGPDLRRHPVLRVERN